MSECIVTYRPYTLVSVAHSEACRAGTRSHIRVPRGRLLRFTLTDLAHSFAPSTARYD